jgi:CNT family concentrative nucleoside transporter
MSRTASEGRLVTDGAQRLVSFGSVAILIGGLGAIDPDRKSLLASLRIRSMISGMLACFMTACFAGMLV